MMRKFGQEIIEATAGKKIHGTGAIPGGINKHLTQADKDKFLHGVAPMNIDHMITWAQDALEFLKTTIRKTKLSLTYFANFHPVT